MGTHRTLPSVGRARCVASQNAEQDSKGACVRRRRWGGSELLWSLSLPGGAAPDAAVAEEEARPHAEGID